MTFVSFCDNGNQMNKHKRCLEAEAQPYKQVTNRAIGRLILSCAHVCHDVAGGQRVLLSQHLAVRCDDGGHAGIGRADEIPTVFNGTELGVIVMHIHGGGIRKPGVVGG